MRLPDLPPDETVRMFFINFRENRLPVCFETFSKESKKTFLKWTLEEVYKNHPEAAQEAGLGEKEINLMFKRMDQAVIRTFWAHFFRSSHAQNIVSYGYFKTLEQSGANASVEVRLEFPSGQEDRSEFKLKKEGGRWRLAYIESGWPF